MLDNRDGRVSPDVSAPYSRFLSGLRRANGYSLIEEGDAVSLAFEPWFLEAANPLAIPCMRITFRRRGEALVLDTFVIDDGSEQRTIDIVAAHDALQAWMDYIAD